MARNTKKLHSIVTKQERDRRKRKPPYPTTRRVNLIRTLKSRDLWLGVYFFIMFQLSIILLSVSVAKDNSQTFLIASMIVAVGITIHGLYVAYQRQSVKLPTKVLNPMRVLLNILVIYGIVFLIGFFFVIIGWETPAQPNQDALNKLLEQYFIPMSFITSVVAPIAEELTFREYLPHAFGPSKVSFIASSVVFTILHAPTGLIGYVVYGFLSAAFLYIRIKNNNLLSSIYAHMGYNMLTVVMSLIF